MKHSKDEFITIRRKRCIHRIMQIVLSLTLAAMLNYIASQQFLRVDITEGNTSSVSPETRQYLKSLNKKVQVYVLLPQDNEEGQSTKNIRKDIKNILRQYHYVSRQNGKAMLEYEFIDSYRHRSRTQQIARKYNVTQDRAIVVATNNRYRVLSGTDLTDLYVTRNRKPVAFRGEAVFTQAILNVTQEEADQVYFLAGHGERQPESTDAVKGLSQFTGFLRQRNMEIHKLNLPTVDAIPDKADCVILVAPLRSLRPTEEDKLRAYLNDADGELMVFLQPGYMAGLENLFYEWGVLADDMAIVDRQQKARAQGGGLIIYNYTKHQITQFLIDNEIPLLLGPSQSIRPDPGGPTDKRLQVLPLLASSKSKRNADANQENATETKVNSWAEPYGTYNPEAAVFNPKTDLPGPVSIAVLAERTAQSDLDLNLTGGKLLVVGNADMVSNQYFQALGNSIFLNNATKWMLERENRFDIPPRKLEQYKLVLSRNQTRVIAMSIATVPLVLGIVGIFVIWIRRR